MTRKTLVLLTLLLVAATTQAQQALDFAKKFMTMCKDDSLVKCITVSPKMMEQIVERRDTAVQEQEAMMKAIGKLKSMRIVSAPAEYYERAQQLIRRHARRFRAEEDFEGENVRSTFYTRKDRKGRTAEMIMLREDNTRNQLTIVCLTGDIDKEFLCFLYNNKSLKD